MGARSATAADDESRSISRSARPQRASESLGFFFSSAVKAARAAVFWLAQRSCQLEGADANAPGATARGRAAPSNRTSHRLATARHGVAARSAGLLCEEFIWSIP